MYIGESSIFFDFWLTKLQNLIIVPLDNFYV
jgi:hypothetical protein